MDPTTPGTAPALVLVHGASTDAGYWEPTIDELARLAPEVRVLNVDLPGRRGVPGDLGALTLADWVGSVVAQVDAAGLREIVLVGHSMAGLTVPGVAAALGVARVRRLVLVAACIPPDGGTVMDTLAPLLRLGIERQARRGGAAKPLPRPLASFFFCNGMSRAQRAFTLSHLCEDASQVAKEPVDRSGLPADVPRTWVLTGKDRSLSPKQQRRFIDHLGGVEEVVEIDTCHTVMVSEPRRLAVVLLRAVRGQGVRTVEDAPTR